MRHATLYFAVFGLMAIAVYGCVASSAGGDRIMPPGPPFVGPPSPSETDIDMDNIAAQVVAKVEAKLQATLSAVANVASGNTTYFSWGVAGIMALGWLVQARSTRLQYLLARSLADQLDKRSVESHDRAVRRIECEFSRLSARGCDASGQVAREPGESPTPAPGGASVEVR